MPSWPRSETVTLDDAARVAAFQSIDATIAADVPALLFPCHGEQERRTHLAPPEPTSAWRIAGGYYVSYCRLSHGY